MLKADLEWAAEGLAKQSIHQARLSHNSHSPFTHQIDAHSITLPHNAFSSDAAVCHTTPSALMLPSAQMSPQLLQRIRTVVVEQVQESQAGAREQQQQQAHQLKTLTEDIWRAQKGLQLLANTEVSPHCPLATRALALLTHSTTHSPSHSQPCSPDTYAASPGVSHRGYSGQGQGRGAAGSTGS